ncbi:MAG TPA: hypothetical protein VGL81_12790 [Polyangiaceae bacterium]
MTSTIQHRLLVVFKLPTSAPALIKVAQATISALTGNAHFPNPNPPLATLNTDVSALNAAETVTQTRAKGTVASRNAARTQLLSDLHTLKGHVQQVADANPDQAETIITSAGMTVRKARASAKVTFSVRQGPLSGSVKLSAKAVALRASYEWESSLDGGKTWTAAPPTLQAKTSISGLPVATSVQFRYRAVTKTGAADWSQPTSLVVT